MSTPSQLVGGTGWSKNAYEVKADRVRQWEAHRRVAEYETHLRTLWRKMGERTIWRGRLPDWEYTRHKGYSQYPDTDRFYESKLRHQRKKFTTETAKVLRNYVELLQVLIEPTQELKRDDSIEAQVVRGVRAMQRAAIAVAESNTDRQFELAQERLRAAARSYARRNFP